MLFYDLGSQALLYVLLNVRCGVVTEEQAVLSRFFLARCMLICVQELLKMGAFLLVWLGKK